MFLPSKFSQQALILSYLPYNSKELNLLSLYNELTVSAYLYLAFLLTDDVEISVQPHQALSQ
jgi:hypothetical protein